MPGRKGLVVTVAGLGLLSGSIFVLSDGFRNSNFRAGLSGFKSNKRANAD